MLNIRNVSVSVGDTPVLKSVSLNAARGEMVALAGPNGAGKTTLLRGISGLLPIRAGTIEFDGRDIRSAGPYRIARMGLAHVPEGRGIFAQLSVRENLRLGCNALRADQKRGDYDRVFDLFPVLSDRLDQQAGMLSGGEQQMLAIGRGLLSRPRILVVDELSLSLAPKVATELLGVLRGLAEDGMTVLLVEQNIHQILRVADRASVLVSGSIAFDDTAAALRSRDDILDMYFGAKH